MPGGFMHLQAQQAVYSCHQLFQFPFFGKVCYFCFMKRTQVTSQCNANKLLDSLLALDRRVVERSLRVYNIPRQERSRMREQMRRVHQAVRAIDLDPRRIAVRNSWR